MEEGEELREEGEMGGWFEEGGEEGREFLEGRDGGVMD